MRDRTGQQLGNYCLIRLLGQGGFAEVYLGEHVHLETQAAIKVLYTQLASEEVEQFRREARTIAHLIHPHIVRVLEFGVEGTTPFLVMDYAPGGTLRTRHPKGTRLPLSTVGAYVRQIAPALQYAHDQKLIHRDIKPENLLVGRNSEILLSDFGIALVAQSSRYQSPRDVAGTIAYMAPEQIEAHPHPASDQYSLGIVLYEWLCGERPFQGTFTEIAIKQSVMPPPSLRERIPMLSEEVDRVVLTALAKDYKQRFSSVQAFATALERAAESSGAPHSFPSLVVPPANQLPLVPPDSETPSQQSATPALLRELGSFTELPSPSDQPFIPLAPVPRTGQTTQSASENHFVPAQRVPASQTFSPSTGVQASPGSPWQPNQIGQMQPPLPPGQPVKRPRPLLIVALVALIIVLIGGSIGIVAAVSNDQATALANAQATATANAQANVQSTVQANAAATVNAQETVQANLAATANAQAQATAGVLQTATAGQLEYSDPLTLGNVHDTTWTNDGTSCFFASDGYHVQVDTSTPQPTKDYAHFCTESDLSYQDTTITIDLRIRGGNSGGLLFRLQNNRGYFFEVGIGGNYQIARWGVNFLQEWTDSSAINRGLDSPNTLQVIAHGSDLLFYVRLPVTLPRRI